MLNATSSFILHLHPLEPRQREHRALFQPLAQRFHGHGVQDLAGKAADAETASSSSSQRRQDVATVAVPNLHRRVLVARLHLPSLLW